MGKMAFLRCPAQFYGSRSEILTSYLDRMCKQTESRSYFVFFFFFTQVMVAFVIFRIINLVLSLGQKEKLKRPAFSLLVGA